MTLCKACNANATSECSCSSVAYCSTACQKADWARHKLYCTASLSEGVEDSTPVSGKYDQLRYMAVIFKGQLPGYPDIKVKFIRPFDLVDKPVIEYDKRKTIFIQWKDSFKLQQTLDKAKKKYEKYRRSHASLEPVLPQQPASLEPVLPQQPVVEIDPTFANKHPDLARMTKKQFEKAYDDDLDWGDWFLQMASDVVEAGDPYVIEWAQRGGLNKEMDDNTVERLKDSLKAYFEARVPRLAQVIYWVNNKYLFGDRYADLIDRWRAHYSGRWEPTY